MMPNPQFPPYLSGQPQTRELSQAYRSIPAAFDTRGVEGAYNANNSMNMAQARSTVGAMSRAAESRAFQSGGKVGASFAGAEALLPYFQQQQSALGDLEDYKLRAAQSALQARTGIGSALAGYRQGATGQMLNYDLAAQQRQQQGGQFDRTLAQQAAQFSAENALRQRQQGFAERQYDDALRLQMGGYGGGRGGGYGGYGGGSQLPTWGEASTIMGAHNSALGSPQAAAYWQRIQAAANQGGYSDRPIFGTGSPY